MLEPRALTPSDIIAILAMVASMASAFYTWYSARNAKQQFAEVEKREREHFRESEKRETEVHVAANYLALETASSNIFQYTAQNEAKIAHLRGAVAKALWEDERETEARGILLNLYYQSLNLFEVCARFRRDDLVEAEVFASWVAWMVEILEDDFFRAQWPDLIRSNYTRDVRDIFDVGVEVFQTTLAEDRRNRAFYAAVADIMAKKVAGKKQPCAVIAGWLDQIDEEVAWKSLPSSSDYLSNGRKRQSRRAKPPISPAA
ncbi:hypothetical protein [Sphingomonas soli]|uniref:hypothetical protein n=1 Tax=Sphingomonas soli TaxID=266127 RepID=UPI000A64CE4F|nr:hypothetical protein [Sphingomonas soli]